jgi:hypothetical protein
MTESERKTAECGVCDENHSMGITEQVSISVKENVCTTSLLRTAVLITFLAESMRVRRALLERL